MSMDGCVNGRDDLLFWDVSLLGDDGLFFCCCWFVFVALVLACLLACLLGFFAFRFSLVTGILQYDSGTVSPVYEDMTVRDRDRGMGFFEVR